tara:strand:- start:463 stop:828 length:366 start_codon:yes stop_codon:yes gene_type:complete
LVKITLIGNGFPQGRTKVASILFKRGETQELDIKDTWMMIGAPYLNIEVERKELDTLNDKQVKTLERILKLEGLGSIKDKLCTKSSVASKVKETVSKVLPSTSKNDKSESSEETEESSESE